MSIEPLYTLNHWREYVRDVGDLKRALHRDEESEQVERTSEWGLAREYCDSYAMPLQFDAIDQLVTVLSRGQT